MTTLKHTLLLVIVGTVMPITPIFGQSDTTVASEGTTNPQYQLDMALEGDGTPLIVYHDSITNSQNIALCEKAGCKGKKQIQTTVTTAAYSSSIAIDAQNMPLYTASDANWILSCFNGNCAVSSGLNTHMAGGSLPVLATDSGKQNLFMAYRGADGGLALFRCALPACETTANSTTVVPEATPIDIDLELDQKGLPVIAYIDSTLGGNALRVVHCDDPLCLEESSATIIPSTGASSVSVGVGTDGAPTMSYIESGQLSVVHCNDVFCDGNNEVPSVVDPNTNAGPYTSLAVDAAGYPVITYQGAADLSLQFVHCNDAGCSGNDETISSPGRRVTAGRSVIKLSGGSPVIAYMDTVAGELHLLSCRLPDCSH